jgi:hypothetical protein
MTQLKNLSLYVSGISDVSALSGLVNLDVLDLSDNSVSDISALSGLSALRELNLNGNQIVNLEPLMGLSGLTRLYLTGNEGLADFTPLLALKQLQYWKQWNARQLCSAAVHPGAVLLMGTGRRIDDMKKLLTASLLILLCLTACSAPATQTDAAVETETAMPAPSIETPATQTKTAEQAAIDEAQTTDELKTLIAQYRSEENYQAVRLAAIKLTELDPGDPQGYEAAAER